MFPLRRPALPLLLATALSACSVGHPIAGIWPGVGDDNDDLSWLALGAIGAAALAADAGTTAGIELRFAYIGGGSLLEQFLVDDATGVLTANATPTVPGGNNMWSVQPHPNNNFVYAADRGGGAVYQYAVDSSTGTLTALTPASIATSAADPLELEIHPSGLHAYAGFNSNSGIDMFSIDANSGQLSAKTPANLTGCSLGRSLAIDPAGNFLYALCDGGNQVRRHSIDASGQLTHLGNTGGISTSPASLGLTPDGSYLYVTSQNSSLVYFFAVNAATGGLTALGTPSTGTDTWPNRVAVDGSGQFAYVNCWNGTAETVRMYNIGSGTGILTDNSPSSISTGGGQPIDMRADPTGRYLYVLNSASNTTNMFHIDTATGALSSNGLAGTTNGPRGIGFITDQ